MNFFQNKKGIELAVNFMVTLIIAIVVFGMGLVLVKKIFTEAENIKDQLDSDTKKELMEISTATSDEVTVYPGKLTIKKGSSDVFGVAILNIDSAEKNFQIAAHQDGSCYDNTGKLLTSGCPAGSVTTINPATRTIKQNEREIINIPVRVDRKAKIATYPVVVTIKIEGTSTELASKIVYISVS